ncbi:MAG: biopolymer transporter ExbD [Deltaproteobacteria bacterium]|nr:biopolymer transporter ExbD [Deltaproteobacteria bacterium]
MSSEAKHHHPKHMIGTAVKARHNTPIHQPGKRLMHSIPLRFVQMRVSGHGSKSVNADLNLTSMIDYLTIVVVFLLSNFGTAQQVSSQQGLEVPSVPHALALRSAPIVSISSQAILLDGQRIANPTEVMASTDRIDRLYERLQDSRRTWPILHAGEPFRGEVVFQIDRATRWDLIKRVAQTCALSGYVSLNFAVSRGNASDLPANGGT